MKKKEARPPVRRGSAEGGLKDFGQRLRQLREKRRLTQEDLAAAIGVTWGIISRYERGLHLPTADRVVALCRVLHVTADYLLRGDRKGEESVPFKNVRLFERFRALDELPGDEQETVLRLVDAVLERHEYQAVSQRRRAS